MKLVKSGYQNLLAIVSYLFIFLFAYAAFSKLLDFNKFQMQLGQSPIFSAYANSLAYAVPILEISIAGLFVFKLYSLFAYYISLALMVMFTTYIILILNFSDYIPCSCGGILENLDWDEHLIFNLVFVIIASVAILVKERQDNQLNYAL